MTNIIRSETNVTAQRQHHTERKEELREQIDDHRRRANFLRDVEQVLRRLKAFDKDGVQSMWHSAGAETQQLVVKVHPGSEMQVRMMSLIHDRRLDTLPLDLERMESNDEGLMAYTFR
jgi:hypothetical protein